MKLVKLILITTLVTSPAFAKLDTNGATLGSEYSINVINASAYKVRSAQQAAKIVKNRYGGKVLKVQTVNKGQGYRVRILKKNGHVVTVTVDAKSGRVSGR